MEFTAADLTDRTPEAAEFAATRFKSVTTGFFRPASLGHPNLYWAWTAARNGQARALILGPGAST